MKEEKIYFPNLNGLRFIAALLVIIHHLEQIKSISKIDNYWHTPFVNIIGRLGVLLFFVLSGFLITYLLLEEERIYTKINVKKFYIRRILRIWPLYFLIVIFALWVLPNITALTMPGAGKDFVYQHLVLKIALFLILCPNLILSFLGAIPYAAHTWSIGIEEQYYLVWPIILKVFKKYRISLMFFIIFLSVFITNFLASHYSDNFPHKGSIVKFWFYFNIDSMAIGALFALLLSRKSKLLQFILNNYVFYSALIIASILIIRGTYIPYIHYEFYSLLFGIIIINFAANKQIGISLENKPLNYLGNISYGIYMFHPIAIGISIYLATLINCTSNWLLYPLTIVITVTIASLSYKYFESRFLKLKARFTKIASGEGLPH
jgi:peptidoglycan/LPS O-acetylase OafA/YrhL